MFSIRRQVLAAVTLLSLLPSSSFAQSAAIGVYQGNGLSACPIPLAQGFTVLEIRLAKTAGPVKTARFKVIPSCPVATSALDFNLTFSPCITAGALMGTIVVIYPTSCSNHWGLYFDVAPATGETQILLTDCDGYKMVGTDNFGFIDYGPCDWVGEIAPYRPSPANGATDVPTNTTLGYVGPANTIQFSTVPLDPYGDAYSHLLCAPASYLGVPACEYPANPGPLAPHTTYYWRAMNIGYYFNGPFAASEIFTFTTGDAPVATEAFTWGRVKAMYRD